MFRDMVDFAPAIRDTVPQAHICNNTKDGVDIFKHPLSSFAVPEEQKALLPVQLKEKHPWCSLMVYFLQCASPQSLGC